MGQTLQTRQQPSELSFKSHRGDLAVPKSPRWDSVAPDRYCSIFRCFFLGKSGRCRFICDLFTDDLKRHADNFVLFCSSTWFPAARCDLGEKVKEVTTVPRWSQTRPVCQLTRCGFVAGRIVVNDKSRQKTIIIRVMFYVNCG